MPVVYDSFKDTAVTSLEVTPAYTYLFYVYGAGGGGGGREAEKDRPEHLLAGNLHPQPSSRYISQKAQAVQLATVVVRVEVLEEPAQLLPQTAVQLYLLLQVQVRVEIPQHHLSLMPLQAV